MDTIGKARARLISAQLKLSRMLLPAMPFGDRFCMNRKGGTRGGGWVCPKAAKNMALSGLSFRNTLVGTGWAILLVLCTNGLKKLVCRAPFLAVTIASSLMDVRGLISCMKFRG